MRDEAPVPLFWPFHLRGREVHLISTNMAVATAKASCSTKCLNVQLGLAIKELIESTCLFLSQWPRCEFVLMKELIYFGKAKAVCKIGHHD